MKIIKALTFITILFFAINIQAQNLEKWPSLESVNSVITRIDTNPKEKLAESITYFSATLNHFADESTKTIPAENKNKKLQKALANLQDAARSLNELVLKTSSEATLINAFSEVKMKFAEVKAQL